MLSPSRFTVNPILLPVENDPFRSQLSTLTFLHWPPFSIRPAVSSESGRRRFDNWCFARHSCLRHLAVVAKSASNAQVTMSRNLNFSETTQCLTINPKVSFSFLSIVWKSWKFWCQNVKVDKDRKEKKSWKDWELKRSILYVCFFTSNACASLICVWLFLLPINHSQG